MACGNKNGSLLLTISEASVLITTHITRYRGGKLAKPRQLWLDNLKDPLFLDSKLIDVIMGMSPCHPSTFIESWQCASLHVKQSTRTPKFQLTPCRVWPVDGMVCKVYFLSKREIIFPVPPVSSQPASLPPCLSFSRSFPLPSRNRPPPHIYLSTMVLVCFEHEL